MRGTPYDKFKPDDLYALIGIEKKNPDDLIFIKEVTNIIRFNERGFLQQRIIIKHTYKDFNPPSKLREMFYEGWVNVPTEKDDESWTGILQ